MADAPSVAGFTQGEFVLVVDTSGLPNDLAGTLHRVSIGCWANPVCLTIRSAGGQQRHVAAHNIDHPDREGMVSH